MKNYIFDIVRSHPIKNEPYFKTLIDGTMTKEKFIETQIKFLDAVLFFSRPMFVISARLDSYEKRTNLLKNILDEHGNGDTEEAHGNTFKKYLLALGASDDDIKNRKSNSAVVSYNKSLMNCATNESTMMSIAMMGIIEERYSSMSAIIVNSILGKSWLDKNSLYHYSLHEELDVQHAEGFYSIIIDQWSNAKSKNEIKRGLALGNSLIISLYNDLL